MAAASKTPKHMCVVNLGFHVELLLPASVGMKLVELLQQSLIVQRDYVGAGRAHYVIGDTPEVTYQSVKASELVFPRDSSSHAVPSAQPRIGRG